MKRKGIILMVLFCLFVGQIGSFMPLSANKKISESEFLNQLAVKMEWMNATGDESIYDVAFSKKIIQKSDKKKLGNALTRERAALFLCRAESCVFGADYDQTLYKKIISNGRIFDLNSIQKSYRASAVKMFEKGIMIGDSNGLYSQSRTFNPKAYVSAAEGKRYITRLKIKKMRKKLSSDGQLIRTTNLPQNAKRYTYILQSFPNAFYQAKFEYQLTKYNYTPVNLVDYASPAEVGKMKFAYNGISMQTVMNNYLDAWCSKVQRNITARFNVNYKTVNSTWINKLRSTYYVFKDDAAANTRQTKDIKDYVERMKANKVVIKTSRVSVERSTLYNCSKDYLRVYVKFKVIQARKLDNLNNVIYGDAISIKSVKKNVWKECYFDIGIGSSNAYSVGEDYSVMDNTLFDIK